MANDPQLQLLVSVCQTSECRARGSDELHAIITRRVQEIGITHRVTVRRGGCWGLCNLGPNVVVRQGAAAFAVEKNLFGGDASFQGRVGEHHYGACTPASVERILTEHLVGGRAVSELASDGAARAKAKKLSTD